MRAENYRADVDGLRFFAVLLVILDHFEFGLSGGYVGVDVFFVISGYVITRQIINLMSQKSFSFVVFFKRRFWRLGPALLVMVVVTTGFFTAILSPTELVILYKNVLANLFYVSNIFIWREYGGYFSSIAKEAPLLHTWSISVEEQFYLIWPVLLYVIYLLSSRFAVFLIATIILLFSVVFSEYFTARTIAASYYLLPTRFFELFVGCYIAMFALDSRLEASVVTREIVSVAALLLLFYSAIYFTSLTPMPGFNGLVPTVGGALFLCSRGAVVNKIFTHPVLVFNGKVSYSLYLWHWPVAVVLFYTDSVQGFGRYYAIAVVFLVAYLSYFSVEKPFRYAYENTRRTLRCFVFFSLTSALILFCAAGIYSHGFEKRYSDDDVAAMRAVSQTTVYSFCHSSARDWDSPLKEECKSDGSGTKLLLTGDSHASHYSDFVRVISSDHQISVLEYTIDSCNPVFDAVFSKDGIRRQAELCLKRNALIKDLVKDEQPEIVVLGANWPNKEPVYFSNGEVLGAESGRFARDLEKTVRYLEDVGSKVVLLREVPGTGDKQHNCSIKNITLNKERDCSAIVSRSYFMDRILSELMTKTSVVVVDVRGLICDAEVCRLGLNGLPLYRDKSHLNGAGSTLLGELYLEMPINIFGE